ncbi:MAG: phosphate ABC transporter permease PstA [Phycisphaerae bacterium]
MSTLAIGEFRPALARRRLVGAIFFALCVLSSLLCVVTLLVLLGRILSEAWPRLDWTLLTSEPSTINPATSGVRPAIWGTVWLMMLTASTAVPIGVGAAIYLQEYARKNWFTRFVQLNLSNLAGVPSIVYGILGLSVFIRTFHMPESVLAGALTLSLLILPVVIIASREALSAVPDSIRQAAFALGATRWQTVRHHVLPAAMPGIMTGVILALSRAIGEAAPLVMIGAFAMTSTVPGENFSEYGWTAGGVWQWFVDSLNSGFAALPIQIYSDASKAEAESRVVAAASIVVLLVLLLTMNAVAVGIRAWHQRHRRW